LAVTPVIDTELRLYFETGKPVFIRNVILRDAFSLNIRVSNFLKSLYEGAGWTIVQYDSPEGAWWSFSET